MKPVTKDEWETIKGLQRWAGVKFKDLTIDPAFTADLTLNNTRFGQIEIEDGVLLISIDFIPEETDVVHIEMDGELNNPLNVQNFKLGKNIDALIDEVRGDIIFIRSLV